MLILSAMDMSLFLRLFNKISYRALIEPIPIIARGHNKMPVILFLTLKRLGLFFVCFWFATNRNWKNGIRIFEASITGSFLKKC